MNTPKHTPLPWAESMPGGQTTLSGRRFTITSRGSMVADMDWNSPTENQANSDLIVIAVNSHADLARQVQELRDALNEAHEALKRCKAAVENQALTTSARFELVRDFSTPILVRAALAHQVEELSEALNLILDQCGSIESGNPLHKFGRLYQQARATLASATEGAIK